MGMAAFTYPFWLPSVLASTLSGRLAPWLTMLLLVLCLAALLLEGQGQVVNAKVIAALGVLVAITAVLRFIEAAIPGPGGFSPIFAPIILAGYVFGSRFGFLMGSLTLLTSALITGGVGPWLPYQMFATGWAGLTAGWLPHFKQPRLVLGMIATFAFIWGLLFGLIMNLYTWPFLVGETATTWQRGSGLTDGLSRYLSYYLLTSLVWDLARAIGNAALILVLGQPAIRALTRFRARFEFQQVEIVR